MHNALMSSSRGASLGFARASLFAFASVVATTGCSRQDPPPKQARPETPASAPSAGAEASPSPLEPQPLGTKIVELETVEDLSEDAANRLIEFSDAVRRRDVDAAAAYLVDDFRGTAWSALTPAGEERLPWKVAKQTLLPPAAPVAADRTQFLASLFALIEPLEKIDFVFFKTRGAEFEADRSRGLVVLTANIIGTSANGAPWSLYANAHGEVRKAPDGWRWSVCVLDKAQIVTRASPPLVDVAASAGIDLVGPRLGSPGAGTFYWRGAAVADVDQDGRFDIFTSTHDRAVFYRNRGDGAFEDATARFGLAVAPGITSPLLFDYDGDGDLDLFCGRVGWEVDGVPNGAPTSFYRNDGAAGFTDVSDASGIASHRIAFGATAADVDGDGDLDLYVCGYNRLDAVYPDSWFGATNGTANALYLNGGDGRFKEVAAARGVAGRAWSYAASFADFDEDGDQDLYVANDYGPNNLYRNRGDGTFEDAAVSLGAEDVGNGMGCAWGDLDGDGRLDLYVSNMASSAGNRILKRLAKKDGSATESTLFKLAAGNSILLQGSDGSFRRLPADAGGVGASWAWGPALLDYDLDGRTDVYVANGFISGASLKDT